MTQKNNATYVWVLAIHDRAEQGFLAFDLRDILECLRPTIESFQWTAFDVECAGESFVAEGELLTTAALLERSKKTVQTIEGKFLAYDRSPDLAMVRWDYSHFPISHAVLCIVAVDSSYFEVYTKSSDHVRLLKRRFMDVREGNPSEYFLAEDG